MILVKRKSYDGLLGINNKPSMFESEIHLLRKLYYAIYQKKFRNGRCDKILKVVVFDLGGTLMQYVGMPHSWEDFYFKGFEEIIRKFRYPISQEIVEKSFQMLKEFNPRINYREVEYSAEYILSKY